MEFRCIVDADALSLSFVQVVAPPTPFDVRPERNLSHRFTSLCPGPDDDGIPTLGSIHRISLGRCPTFKLAKNSPKPDWFHSHLSLMFSDLEKQRMLHAPDTLVHVKQTLCVLLRSAAGADPDDQAPGRVFALFDTLHKVEYLYIVVARMCLDVGSHTVVADAFVVPGTPAVRAALAQIATHDACTFMGDGHSQGPRNPDDLVIRCILTDADETAVWFHLLPRLTERCRTWPHKATCVYRTSKKHQQRSGEHSWGRQSPLCTCGVGIGTEILPKHFERLAPNLTRAAFSPLLPVPYLKEVDVPMGSPVIGMGTFRENVMFRAPLRHDRSVDDGKMDAVGVTAARAGHRCGSCGKMGGLTCGRCKRARYCSKECQRADWKVHKKDCQKCTGGS